VDPRDGYSVQIHRATGALLLVGGHRELAGYDLLIWTAGTRLDGEEALRAVQARLCRNPLRGRRAWCRLDKQHPGACR
jgi:hypothetical protein